MSQPGVIAAAAARLHCGYSLAAAASSHMFALVTTRVAGKADVFHSATIGDHDLALNNLRT